MRYSSLAAALLAATSSTLLPSVVNSQAPGVPAALPAIPPIPPPEIPPAAPEAPPVLYQSFEEKCPDPLRNENGCRCIPVTDYDDLRGAIERMDDGECKCFQPFSVTKADDEPEINIDDVRNVKIICQNFGQCEILGGGTHLVIEGERSAVTVSGFRFLGATESAIVVKDGTGTSKKNTREQTFCDNEFVNNENNWADGGAIKVGTSAKVYVGNSYFEQNHAARMGGAISGEAAVLQVLDSSFKANTAKLGGAIATNKPEAVLVLADCEFDENDAEMGPTYGPAVAANGKVEDFGGNVAQPQDLMCLSCELVAGTRIRPQDQPLGPPPAVVQPPVQPVQQVVQQPVQPGQVEPKAHEAIIDSTVLDTAGMDILLPPTEDVAAPLVVVEDEQGGEEVRAMDLEDEDIYGFNEEDEP